MNGENILLKRQVASSNLDLKSLLSKLAPICQDSDPFIHRMLRHVLQNIYGSTEEQFWIVWETLKPAEKKSINHLFGKDIKDNTDVLVASPKVF